MVNCYAPLFFFNLVKNAQRGAASSGGRLSYEKLASVDMREWHASTARVLLKQREQSVECINDQRPFSRDSFEGFLGKLGNLDVV